MPSAKTIDALQHASAALQRLLDAANGRGEPVKAQAELEMAQSLLARARVEASKDADTWVRDTARDLVIASGLSAADAVVKAHEIQGLALNLDPGKAWRERAEAAWAARDSFAKAIAENPRGSNDSACHFCGAWIDGPRHEPHANDCAYIAATRHLEGLESADREAEGGDAC